jgi:hypothetical protein
VGAGDQLAVQLRSHHRRGRRGRHAGAALVREVADRVGLTAALGWRGPQGRRREPDAAAWRVVERAASDPDGLAWTAARPRASRWPASSGRARPRPAPPPT